MIGVVFTCAHDACDRVVTMRLSGNHIFANIRVKDLKPKGWTIRMPKNGSAVAYCGEHAETRAKAQQRLSKKPLSN